MRVIVCGSRRVYGSRPVYHRLGQLPPDTTIVEGGADGVDAQARAIAEERGWKCETYPADWKGQGKKAGPLRNQRMVDMGADLLIAFPASDSIGTWDCVTRAKAANIPVKVIEL